MVARNRRKQEPPFVPNLGSVSRADPIRTFADCPRISPVAVIETASRGWVNIPKVQFRPSLPQRIFCFQLEPDIELAEVV